MKLPLSKTLAVMLVAVMLLASCSPRPDGASPPVASEAQSPESVSPIESSMLEQSLNTKPVDLSSMVMDTSLTLVDLDLSIPQTFAIARPAKQITTDFESYFITGTSDPNQPVYYGSTEIARQGTMGTFGVHVPLTIGTNTFTFSQGSDTATVTIIRTQKAGIGSISTITQSSIYPAVMGGVKVGNALLLECTAPSGGAVSATFEGKTVALTQVAQANAGIPAVFRGSVTVDGDYADDVTTNAGKIAYSLTYNGATTNYESTGDVYVAGSNSNIAVEVTSYMGFLQFDANTPGSYREQLKMGSTDYVKSQTNTFYELNSGGFLSVDQAQIIEGTVSINNKINDVTLTGYEKSEIFAFDGTSAPAFYTKMGDGTFAITFFNTRGTPSVNIASSRLFSDVSVTDNGGSVSYVFTMKSGSLWGYNVFHDGSITYLRCAYKPQVSGSSLSGVTVVLDPGHGGNERGALGLAGESGPTEADINLAHTLATKEALENMGAKVLVTRTDGTLSLDDRLKFFDSSNADIYVSLHHNSLVESTDANKVAGMEIYYHTPMSRNFSNSLMNALATNLNRNNRGIKQSYYRVTLSSYAPSLLLELAYISNPLEYERATNKASIQQAGQAIAQSIKSVLS